MSLDLPTTILGEGEITSESQTKALIQTLIDSRFKLQALAKILRCHPTNLSQWLYGKGRHWVGEEVRVWLNRHRTETSPETKTDWELLLWVAPAARVDDPRRVFVHATMRVRDLKELMFDQSAWASAWNGIEHTFQSCTFKGQPLDPEMTWADVRDKLGYDYHNLDHKILLEMARAPSPTNKLKTD